MKVAEAGQKAEQRMSRSKESKGKRRINSSRKAGIMKKCLKLCTVTSPTTIHGMLKGASQCVSDVLSHVILIRMDLGYSRYGINWVHNSDNARVLHGADLEKRVQILQLLRLSMTFW